jgi:hypothetical protein
VTTASVVPDCPLAEPFQIEGVRTVIPDKACILIGTYLSDNLWLVLPSLRLLKRPTPNRWGETREYQCSKSNSLCKRSRQDLARPLMKEPSEKAGRNVLAGSRWNSASMEPSLRHSIVALAGTRARSRAVAASVMSCKWLFTTWREIVR